MEAEDLEQLLKQYATLAWKSMDTKRELDRLHELVRVEGVYTYTSSNKAIWSDIHEKITGLTEVNKELNRILDRILSITETRKP